MYYFILNPSSQSSGSRSIWNRLVKILKEKNISYKVYATTYPGQGTVLAGEISRNDPHAVIVAIGGDGTVHDIL
ncbi:MAG: acylglycerol kinase family protein, partial [Lachnospiraceae bacterium]|nr:acylglycerol kinase family protein [Lachnospiraceae bacterium]